MADTYDFTAKRGDTWNGATFTIIVNGTPKDLTTTTIACSFKKEKRTGQLLMTLVDGNGITKTDPANGVITIDPVVLNFPAGIHYYDIEFTTGTEVKTYVEGRATITQDVTD